MNTNLVITLISLLLVQNLFGSENNNDTIRKGISLEMGIMNTTLIDEYISSNTYSGSYPFASIGWIHNWQKGFIEINLMVGNTEEMSSGNVSAWYEHQVFRLNLFYKLNNNFFGSNKTQIYIGPFFDHSWYYFNHIFASQTRYESQGSNLSAGLNALLKYQLSNKIDISLKFYSSILSVVNKSFDYQKHPDNEENSKLTIPLSSGLFGTKLAIQTRLTQRIEAQLKYGLNYIWINEWDKYRSSSDCFAIEVRYVF